MKDRQERKYRVVDCCECCENHTEKYDSGRDVFTEACTVDGKFTVAWFVCDDFKR